MIIGYAICDLDQNNTDLARTLKKLPANAIELQKEGNSWGKDQISKSTKKYDFISVHAPTRYTDLSSMDPKMLEYSQKKTIETMNLANEINAHTLVIHPVHHEGWLEPKDRIHKKNIFLSTFENVLVPHYLDNFHEYRIAIENIEYSKYPATLEETGELHAALNTIHPVGIVLDIPHIWNTRRILAENEHLEDKVYGYPWTPEILYDYVEKFIRHNKEHIDLYHIANFGENPVRTHDYIARDKIHPELEMIIPLIKDKPIILEVYNHNYQPIKESKKAIEEIAR